MMAATGSEKIWQKAAQLHRIHRRASISLLPKGADTNLQLLFEFVVDAGNTRYRQMYQEKWKQAGLIRNSES